MKHACSACTILLSDLRDIHFSMFSRPANLTQCGFMLTGHIRLLGNAKLAVGQCYMFAEGCEEHTMHTIDDRLISQRASGIMCVQFVKANKTT